MYGNKEHQRVNKLMNKYHAKPFWYNFSEDTFIYPDEGLKPRKQDRPDYWYFASQLEWKIFEIIKTRVAITRIRKDDPIVLIDRKVDGKHIEVIYKPDFTFYLPNAKKPYYVECKGFFTEVSKLKLRVLCLTRPEVAKRLHLVFDRSRTYIKAELPIGYHSIQGFEEWITTL